MFKVKEFSVTEVLNDGGSVRKGGFEDVHDALEYAINVLGADTVKKGSKLMLHQRIFLEKLSK